MRTIWLVLALALYAGVATAQSEQTLVLQAWASTNGPYGASWSLDVAADGSAQVTSSAAAGARRQERRFTISRAQRDAILRAVEEADFFALPEFVGPTLVEIHGPDNCLDIRVGGRVRRVVLNEPASSTGEAVERFRKVWRSVSESSPIKPPQ
jgi:hypothetical protein